MNLITGILLLTIVGLHYALWTGDKNVIDLRRLQQSVADTIESNQALQQRNQKLLAEVIDLKQGGETIETLARAELGLIKPDETFYQIIE